MYAQTDGRLSDISHAEVNGTAVVAFSFYDVGGVDAGQLCYRLFAVVDREATPRMVELWCGGPTSVSRERMRKMHAVLNSLAVGDAP